MSHETSAKKTPTRAPAGSRLIPLPGDVVKTALRTVSVKGGDDPYATEILIDGKKPECLESLSIKIGIGHPNRVTVTFVPEMLEVEGQFEGWAKPVESRDEDMSEGGKSPEHTR